MGENNVIIDQVEEIEIEQVIGLDKELQMQENYKRIGDFIQLVDERNRDLQELPLTGLSITKKFIPSVANIIGTDLSNYKIIRKFQFACSLMQVSRDGKIPIAMMEDDVAIMSPAYPMFEIVDHEELLPAYLMMWFERSEFDREAAYYAIGGIRGNLTWEDFCDMTLPIPSINKQKEIVKEYKVIQDRIELKNRLIQKLEETAQTIYKQWFVEFEFPNENGNPYKSSGGEMVWNEELGKEIPESWEVKNISDLAFVKHGYAFKGENFTEGETSLLLVSPGNFKLKGGFNFEKNKFFTGKYPESYILSENDLIINMTDLSKNGDTLGNTALIPKINFKTLLHNQRVGKFELKDLLYTFYLFFITNQKDYNHYILGTATGTTVRHTSPDRIANFQIILPEEKVIEKFNLLVRPIIKLINQNPTQNYKLNELKELLLSKLPTI